MVKTTDDAKETVTTAGFKYQNSEHFTVDKDGNIRCVRCGWSHTTTECAEYRLVHANKELEKVTQFLHTPLGQEIGVGHSGESPVDTLIRGIRQLKDRNVHTEITKLMDKDEAAMKGKD